MKPLLLVSFQLLAALVAGGGLSVGRAAQPSQLLADYRAQAGTPVRPELGQKLFTQRNGQQLSCASCHGEPPTQIGKHTSTGKPIGPLAPAANAERFTDRAKTEKWFRRNCNDVFGRECSASEKADVLAWLIDLRR